MKLSLIVKIVLALFLGGFLWLVVTSIQAPQPRATTDEPQEQLREELLSIAENVTISIGDVTIEADLQETYRNNEVHYQNFTMTQRSDERTTIITGRTAQTLSEGTDVEYFIFEKDVVVNTDDGLHLETERLNYEAGRGRIFTQEPAEYTLNEISGSSRQFIYFTEERRLELRGNVQAEYVMKSETEGVADRVIDIRGQRLIYDQQEHTLEIQNRARIAEKGSYILGDNIFATLTDDNAQFRTMRIEKAESRTADDGEDVTEEPEVTEDDPAEEENRDDEAKRAGSASLSLHTSGIKRIEGNEMLVEFTIGDDNLLRRITAEGAASMDVTPRGTDLREPGAEYKKLSGNQIIAQIDTETGGIETLSVISGSGLSTLEQRLLNIQPEDADLRKSKPRYTRAKTITMTIDPETNLLQGMAMQEDMRLTQGDLVATARDANYQASNETMVMEGSPTFRDSGKLVKGGTMTISFLIDDLDASGGVSCEFFQPEENAGPEARSVFAIGSEGGKTVINAGSLRLDYSNNILRYGKGVTLVQGGTRIRCEAMDIFQIEEKLIARGNITASLTFENIDSNRPAQADSKPADTDDEKSDGKRQAAEKGISLKGNLLEINKTERFVRMRNRATAIQKQFTINADEISYELNEEDRILNSLARRSV